MLGMWVKLTQQESQVFLSAYYVSSTMRGWAGQTHDVTSVGCMSKTVEGWGGDVWTVG